MKHIESIQHIPNGVGPDMRIGAERFPPYPVQGDFVIVDAVVRPEGDRYDTLLEWTLNGNPVEPVKGLYVSDYANKLYYYRFELGRFNEGDMIKYRILAKSKCDTQYTREYSFKVYNMYRPENLDSVEQVEGGAKLLFTGSGKFSFPPLYIGFKEGDIKISLTSDNDLSRFGNETNFIRYDETCVLKDRTSGKRVVIDRNSSRICIKDENDVTLLESCDGPDGFLSLVGSKEGRIHSFKLSFTSGANGYFGFGEKFDSLNQKGLSPRNYVYNKPGEQGAKTYIPVPFFFTEKGYGMFVDTSYQVDFAMGTKGKSLMEISARTNVDEPSLDLLVFFGRPKSIIKRFLEVTGTPKLPPKWVFGPWMSSNNWNTQKDVLAQIEIMNELDIPATVVVIEAWSDESTFYIFNDSMYRTVEGEEALKYKDFRFNGDCRWPDPKSMIDSIHENNLKLVLWQIPALKTNEYNVTVQHMIDMQYVVDNKLCVTYNDGTPFRINYDWFSNSLLPDFTNPRTREWWIKKRRYLVDDLGVDGFKTDGGEFVFDDDLVFYNGEDGAQMRNKYPGYYVSTYHEFINDDMVTFSRAGSTGSQKYPIYWSGDQHSTFEEFRSIIRASLSTNISGNPFCGFDIGGFSSEISTVELFIRGAQFAVFCPVMQFHSEGLQGKNNDRSPWNMEARTGDKRIIDIYRKFAAVRMNLIPYIYNEAVNVSKKCEPLMRPLFVDNSEDSNTYGLEFEYMFGRNLLVAPMVEEGIWQRDIYLPEGEWMDFWNGDEYRGNRYIRYNCGLDSIPVFIKKGSIIPMNLNDDFEVGGCIGNRLDAYKNLCFIITGNIENEFRFSDDIGNTALIYGGEGRLEVNIQGAVDRIYLLSGRELDGYTRQFRKTINGTGYNVYMIEN